MAPPRITFFNELPSAALVELFAIDGVETFLRDGGYALSMGLIDLTEERAQIVRRLEASRIPVTGWLLLDLAEGYWLNADNAAAARRRYEETIAWADASGLRLHRIGLDIETPRADAAALMQRPRAALWEFLRRRRSPQAIEAAERAYGDLVADIRAAGRSVEAYHFPFLMDERIAGSRLLRRTLGVLDIDCDLEVPMLYSTYLGESLAVSYFAESPAIALGVTGGGVNADDPRERRRLLSGAMLERQLLAAARSSEELYVFSLEGCVWNGLLPQLRELDWRRPVPETLASPQGGARRRMLLRTLLRTEPLLDWILPARS